MKLKNILLVYTRHSSTTLNKVKKVLNKYKVRFNSIQREKVRAAYFKNRDLVIAVGGDGTLLRAAQYITDKTFVLGVNTNPEINEGFYMTTDKHDFENKLNNLINNKITILKLNRLKAIINNKPIPELALNEFYIGSDKAYSTSRYCIITKGKREFQKSSGVLVATSSGSYAWLKSAGGEVLPLTSKK